MKNQTLLQKITDILEAAGIGVSGIETWPPEEDGRVSVSLTVRLPAGLTGGPGREQTEALIAALNKARDPSQPDKKTDAIIDAINADKAPDDPPAIRNPCGECASGDCDNCGVKDSIPIKLYTPEEAATALKKGRVLRNEKGDKFSYVKSQFWGMGFYREDKDGHFYVAHDLSGLYEEGKYV
jgi:hypothetical protein